MHNKMDVVEIRKDADIVRITEELFNNRRNIRQLIDNTIFPEDRPKPTPKRVWTEEQRRAVGEKKRKFWEGRKKKTNQKDVGKQRSRNEIPGRRCLYKARTRLGLLTCRRSPCQAGRLQPAHSESRRPSTVYESAERIQCQHGKVPNSDSFTVTTQQQAKNVLLHDKQRASLRVHFSPSPPPPLPLYMGRGGVVVRLPACYLGEPSSIPSNVTPGIFACGNRGRRCRWSESFLGDAPPPSLGVFIPVLLHSHLVSPPSALNTAQISSLIHIRTLSTLTHSTRLTQPDCLVSYRLPAYPLRRILLIRRGIVVSQVELCDMSRSTSTFSEYRHVDIVLVNAFRMSRSRATTQKRRIRREEPLWCSGQTSLLRAVQISSLTRSPNKSSQVRFPAAPRFSHVGNVVDEGRRVFLGYSHSPIPLIPPLLQHYLSSPFATALKTSCKGMGLSGVRKTCFFACLTYQSYKSTCAQRRVKRMNHRGFAPQRVTGSRVLAKTPARQLFAARGAEQRIRQCSIARRREGRIAFRGAINHVTRDASLARAGRGHARAQDGVTSTSQPGCFENTPVREMYWGRGRSHISLVQWRLTAILNPAARRTTAGEDHQARGPLFDSSHCCHRRGGLHVDVDAQLQGRYTPSRVALGRVSLGILVA
ncbi:hypothetical protein PR048_007652 [Dryococelus australis]|uniref:Uncharacterized protein n=1 Tax=Dryococelus australis TaxID=614101 RepID=A0ABQ9HUU2_9NEOP|nr:hypothetical protein PR048_007652 [Dryococelus australis]